MDASIIAAMFQMSQWFAVGGIFVFLLALCGIEKRENKMWKELGIKSPDDKYPLLIHKECKPEKTTYIFHIPNGIDMAQMEEGKKWYNTIKQSFGDMHYTEIEVLDGHRLAITVYEHDLEYEYKFDVGWLKNSHDPLKIPVGVSHKGMTYLEIGDSAPHVGIAGQTGSGKSTLLRVILTWLVLHPIKVDIYLSDLKGGVEGRLFERSSRIKGFAKEPQELINILKTLICEMKRRLQLFYDTDCVNIDQYNKEMGDKGKHLRKIILVIDEFADLAEYQDAMNLLTELGRKSRATGIFTMPATQNPESKVMKSSYKSNVPAWFCFKVKTFNNSINILNHAGAEKLRGKGHCIFDRPLEGEIELQGYYISPDECKKLVKYTYVEKQQAVMNFDASGVLE